MLQDFRTATALNNFTKTDVNFLWIFYDLLLRFRPAFERQMLVGHAVLVPHSIQF